MHPPTVLRFRPAGAADAPGTIPLLEYFAYRALNEHIQLLMEVTGRPYDYVCHWNPRFMGAIRYRDYAPHGQLPMLHDPALGFPLAESRAIFFHLARSAGLMGSSPAEMARIEMLCELAEDVRTNTDWMGEDRYLKAAERAVSAGARSAGLRHLVGTTLSAADVWLFWALQYKIDTDPAQLAPYKQLRAFHDAFAALPAVTNYYGSPRAFPLSKHQLDPHNVPGEYELENYVVTYKPAVYAERWCPDEAHPAAGAGR